MKKKIAIKNARQNNLKNISLEIPYYELNVVTGNSGSGKSSLVYDTIYAESQRLMYESLVDGIFGAKIMEKPDVDFIENLCPAVSISQFSYNFNPNSTVGSYTDIDNSLRTIFSVIASALGEKVFSPRDFSFMQSKYRCQQCRGKGTSLAISLEKLIPDRNLSLEEGGISYFTGNKNSFEMQLLYQVCDKHNISYDEPINKLKKEELDIILYGSQEDKYVVKFARGTKKNCQKTIKYNGVWGILEEKYQKISSPMIQRQLEKYLEEQNCICCEGAGFESEVLEVIICNQNYSQVSKLEINEVLEWLEKVNAEYSSQVYFKSIKSHIEYIKRIIQVIIGLNVEYLSLDRSIPTLSGGELQRLRLAKQVSGSLCEILYILDEPCKGLHAIDVQKIINISKKLIEKRNTILAIEHNPNYIKEANNIITLGPGTGPEGGRICDSKDYEKTETIKFEKNQKRCVENFYQFKNIEANNIKGINVNIPQGIITCITGVSGSGKTTLAKEVIYNSLKKSYGYKCELVLPKQKKEKVYYVDQKPIGKNARSTVVSYLDIYDDIRNVFSKIEYKGKKYSSSFFSTNCDGGRCEKCMGNGIISLENSYFTDAYIICDQCNGTRFKEQILDIKYMNKNIADILEMSVSEAKDIFIQFSKILKMLQCLEDIGLGYLKLGQMSQKLSGGEAQRIKLAKVLGEESRKTNKVYILDEPTSGLSRNDIAKLEKIIHNLIDENNTVIIIEHNIQFIFENADYIVDMGLLGGKKGGKILDAGFVQEIYDRKKASICVEEYGV